MTGKGIDPKRDQLPDMDDEAAEIARKFIAGEIRNGRGISKSTRAGWRVGSGGIRGVRRASGASWRSKTKRPLLTPEDRERISEQRRRPRP